MIRYINIENNLLCHH